MKDVKTFICILGANYFQKTITLEKGALSTKYVRFYLDSVEDSECAKQKCKKEMKKLISENDVIIATTDFGNYSIITTGGIIIADDLPRKIANLAIEKRDNRRAKLNSIVSNDAYSAVHFDLYEKNRETIKALLNLQKDFYDEFKNAKVKDYQQLLECLIGITEPSDVNDYEETAKQLLKEYSTN